MGLLTRLHNPQNPYATGIIPPLVRVATHIGYCAGLAGAEYDNPEEWDTVYANIKDDLDEAISHMSEPPDMSPFIPQEVIDGFDIIKTQIAMLTNQTQEQNELFTDLQILNHNIARVAAQYEFFTAGLDSSEGSQA